MSFSFKLTTVEIVKSTCELFGYNLDGEKVKLIINNIECIFIIQPLKDNINERYIIDVIRDIDENIEFDIEQIKGNEITSFLYENIPLYKITLNNIFNNKKLLNNLTLNNNIKLLNNDTSIMKYYRKLFYEKKIKMGNTFIVKNYLKYNVKNKTHVYKIENFDELQEVEETPQKNGPYILCWDVETFDPDNAGVPKPENDSAHIFMICIVIYNYTTKQIKSKYVLTLKNMEKIDNEYIILCKDEKELILKFAEVFNVEYPDYEVTFNGFEYDWDFIVKRINKYKIVKEFYNIIYPLSENNFNLNNIKPKIIKPNIKVKEGIIWGEDEKKEIVTIPGIINIDIMILLKKLNYTGENKSYSLNAFLKAFKLENKFDLPYLTMFKYYVDGEKNKISEIAKYCLIDSISCFRLFDNIGTVEYLQASANTSYLSLSDIMMNADGLKVTNLYKAYAYEQNKYFDLQKNHESFRVDGGYVMEPIPGIEKKYPISGLDFQSLYPSIMMQFNMCLSTMVNEVNYEKYKDKYKLVKLPLDDDDFMDSENRVPTCYFLSREEKIGLLTQMITNLREDRLVDKNELKKVELLLESGSNSKENEIKKIVLNSRQLSKKLIINTAYGQLCDKWSCMHESLIGACVTYLGRYHVQLAKKYVETLDVKVRYGDTDSIYIMPLKSHYNDFDNLTPKEKIEQSFGIMKKISNLTNKIFYDKYGNNILNMIVEEVLFPCIFTNNKKQYIGYEHKGKVCLDNPHIFVRGFDKKNKTKFQMKEFYNLIHELFEFNGSKTTVEIIEEFIVNLLNKENMDISDFEITAQYKEEKKNIMLKTLVSKIKDLHENEKFLDVKEQKYIVPENGEKITYVFIDHGKYNSKGCKLNMKSGEKIMLSSIAKKDNLPIDVSYYIEHFLKQDFILLLTATNKYNIKEAEYAINNIINEKYGGTFKIINKVKSNTHNTLYTEIISHPKQSIVDYLMIYIKDEAKKNIDKMCDILYSSQFASEIKKPIKPKNYNMYYYSLLFKYIEKNYNTIVNEFKEGRLMNIDELKFIIYTFIGYIINELLYTKYYDLYYNTLNHDAKINLQNELINKI